MGKVNDIRAIARGKFGENWAADPSKKARRKEEATKFYEEHQEIIIAKNGDFKEIKAFVASCFHCPIKGPIHKPVRPLPPKRQGKRAFCNIKDVIREKKANITKLQDLLHQEEKELQSCYLRKIHYATAVGDDYFVDILGQPLRIPQHFTELNGIQNPEYEDRVLFSTGSNSGIVLNGEEEGTPYGKIASFIENSGYYPGTDERPRVYTDGLNSWEIGKNIFFDKTVWSRLSEEEKITIASKEYEKIILYDL